MKIGIVSSGNETLAIRKVLTKYNHHYLLYHDQTFFPFGSKDFSFILQEIHKAIRFLREQGAEAILLDPVYELALHQKETDILPLFTTYLQAYAFKYSLVGKIGMLTDVGSSTQVQELIQNIEQGKLSTGTAYQPTEQQKHTKVFSFPFHYWVKAANARPAGIASLGVHNPYLIRTLKNDLRYFKDANIDTLVPMHYHYFSMQRTIKSFFNFHKTKFHDLSVIEECFKKLIENGQLSPYSVTIRTNQSPDFLLKEKELVWLLQRGKGVQLKIETI